MFRLKISVLAAVLASAAWAQTAAQLDSPAVKRVGARIACTCGCKSSVACEMPGGCSYCKRMRTQIVQMQDQGKSDQAVIAAMVREAGPDSYLGEPGKVAWIIPYVALAFGLLVIYWFVRKQLMAPATGPAAPPLDSASLERYNKRIEQDLEKLE